MFNINVNIIRIFWKEKMHHNFVTTQTVSHNLIAQEMLIINKKYSIKQVGGRTKDYLGLLNFHDNLPFRNRSLKQSLSSLSLSCLLLAFYSIW